MDKLDELFVSHTDEDVIKETHIIFPREDRKNAFIDYEKAQKDFPKELMLKVKKLHIDSSSRIDFESYGGLSAFTNLTHLIYICENVQLPETLINLEYLSCHSLEFMDFGIHSVVLPKSYAKLKYLNVSFTDVKELPNYTNLEVLYARDSGLKSIPELPNLKTLICNYYTEIPKKVMERLEFVQQYNSDCDCC